MFRAYLPFLFLPSTAATKVLGLHADRVAVLALKAVLKHNRSLDVAHEQVRFRGQDFAFSSRVTASGDLVIDLDIGDPRLGHRLVLEEELRRAERKARDVAGLSRRRSG